MPSHRQTPIRGEVPLPDVAEEDVSDAASRLPLIPGMWWRVCDWFGWAVYEEIDQQGVHREHLKGWYPLRCIARLHMRYLAFRFKSKAYNGFEVSYTVNRMRLTAQDTPEEG